MTSNSFFEKLKKGMGVESPVEAEEEKYQKAEEEIINEKEIEADDDKESKKIKRKIKFISPEKNMPKIEEKIIVNESPAKEEILNIEEEKELKEPIAEPEKEETIKEAEKKEEEWFEAEGELAIDIYQTENDLIIQSAIAGVKPENLDIILERDVLTIRGIRQKPFEEEGDYFTQECYWGPFSREIILPVEIDPDRSEASMKDGVLVIRIPKILRDKKRKIKVII